MTSQEPEEVICGLCLGSGAVTVEGWLATIPCPRCKDKEECDEG